MLELFTERDMLELPKLSHSGTVVRLERDRVSLQHLNMMEEERKYLSNIVRKK
jgi:hypothetical protein